MTINTHASTGALRLTATLLLGTMLATAAHAETLTVTDIVPPDAPLYKLSIPTVEVTDGNLTETQVRELFQIGSFDDLTKWSGITAASLKIPTVSLTVSVPSTTGSAPVDETITITDIQLNDVVDGVAGSTQIGGAEIRARSDGPSAPEIAFTYGRMTSGRYDLGAMLAYYGIGDTSGTEMKPVYDNLILEGGQFAIGDVVKCDIGAITNGNMFAKSASVSLNDVMTVMQRFEAAATANPPTMPAPADIKTIVTFYTGLLTAFRSEPSHLDGIECVGTDPTTSTSFTVSAGDMDIGSFEPGVYPDISVDDFAFDGGPDNGSLAFGNFTWKQMDLNGPIDALNAAVTLDEAWFTANWRKLIPAMDGLSISDVTFDLPAPGTPGQRSQGAAGLFDITLGKYINGLPSEIALALDDATLPLPPELSAGPAAAEIAARGITEITSDTRLKLHWDEASNTIVVDELLSDADQFFRINVTGNIGNATPALFSDNEQEAMTAGMGLTVKDLTIDIEDRGFYGMVLAISSAEGGQPLQATRMALSGMAQGMTLAILGSDEMSLKAVGELGKFLSGANSKVSITLTAKDGAGLSLADLSALEKDPTVLAGKVTVSAVASGDPVPQVEVAPTEPAPTSPSDPSLSLEEQKQDLKAPAQQ